MIAPEKLVTFRKPYADSRRKAIPNTWFAEGMVGIVIRADGDSRYRSRRGMRYLVMWECPDGQTITNYLPAGAIKEIR